MRTSISGSSSARRGIAAAMVAAALLATAACGDSGNEPAVAADGDEPTSGDKPTSETQPAGEMRDVTVALPVPLGLFWSPYIIAAEKFYPEMGINVDLPSVDGSASVAQQIATGNAFAGSVSVRETYAARAAGGEVMAIAAFGRGLINRVSVPDDSPIQSLADLKGKAIGVPSASDGSVALVKQLMEEAGISEDEYEIPAVGAGGPAVAAAFDSGRIAAYAHGLSDIPALKVNAGMTLRSLMPEKYQALPAEGFVVSEESMADPEDREVAINLVRGYFLGAWFLQEHPEEAKEIVCGVIPSDCTDDEYVNATLELVSEKFAPEKDGKAGAFDYENIQILLDMTLGEALTVPVEEAFNGKFLESINDGLLEQAGA
ncbi:ABC transporter substrate-binding protein [Georgenia yuyongxinii]|nr:ABC transporter substrate-binding protein [Georgenia yuyongxinii]